MTLLKIKDFDPNYKDTFGGYDIKGLDIYSDVNNEKIGSIYDLLVDEQGHFRYFIVDLGFWGFGKKVLLPVGRAQIDSDGRHVHALGFTKDQAENLPEFNDSLKIDNQYEERVRGVYRPHQPAEQPTPAYPLEASAPVEHPRSVPHPQGGSAPPPPPPPAGYPPSYPQPQQPYAGQAQASRSAGYSTPEPQTYYDYQQDPALYGMNEQSHSVLQRYEQRLMAKRHQPPQPRQ